MSATMLYSLASIYHLWGLSEHAARTSRRRWKQDYQPPLKPLLLGGLRFFLKTFSRHGERVSWFPAAKGWILTSPCLWSCDQQHLGDVAEVADTSVMQCHAMLRCVMSCYVILSYTLGFQPPLKLFGAVNKIPPWIKLPKGFKIIEFGSTKELFGPRLPATADGS